MSAVAPPSAALTRWSPARAAWQFRRVADMRPATTLRAVGFAGVVLAFAAYRVWQAAAGPAIVWTDSMDYDRSAIWAGSRPPLVPALLAVSPTFGWFVGVQTAFAVAAWGLLAWAVAARVSRPSRAAAGTAVLAFAATTAVVRWDRSVLTESLAMSSCALLLAALLWAHERTTWPRVGALVVAAVLFAAVRDTDVWIVWLLALAVAIDTIASHRGVRGIVAALSLAAFAGALLGGSLAAQRTEPNVEHVFFVRIFPYPDRVDWFAAHGMPDADVVREYVAATHPHRGMAPVVGIDHRDARVPRLVRWLHEDGPAAYVQWVVEHPWYVLTEPARSPERAYNFAAGNLAGYSGPERTELAPVDAVMTPNAGIVVGVGLASCIVIACTRRRRSTGMRVASLFAALGLVHMLLAWHGDGMETTRHASVANVQARLGVLVLVVLAAAALRDRVRAPQESHDGRVTSVRRGYIAPMATYEDIPPPEPKEIDEQNWLQLKDLIHRSVLKGHPYEGNEQCDNCLYYLDADDDISYCWHPTLRILVGGQWWCQWWEAASTD